ncbi:hypothetical protein [Luteolibacter sp. Populi]|uniref:hypothetical protein n=1 Tax=Luteolibacter sp. Populi TaxID=3230487 RepID=UPI003466628D
MLTRPLAAIAALLLTHCAPHTVRRMEAIEIAYTYSRISWTPEQRHVKHGPDKDGVLVHTPDTTLSAHGLSNGWWQTGKPARGMAYQWGGFDTPEQFLASLAKGEAAGDISTAGKRRLGDAGTSREACGIDCSGFVSRCWRLSKPVSTKELPAICDKLGSWSDLKAGDILLNHQHVLLFAKSAKPGKTVYVYEAGPFPVWRVNAAEIPVDYLLKRGYAPWRYRGIRD